MNTFTKVFKRKDVSKTTTVAPPIVKEDTVMQRAPLGIKVLDKVFSGGIPSGHSVLLLGPPGTGKTVMGLQFINEGLKRGETCVIISLEETEKSLLTAAKLLGFEFQEYINRGKLRIENMPELLEDPRDFVKFSVELSASIQLMRIKRVFIDPLAVLETAFINKKTMQQDLKSLRMCLDRIFKSVKAGGATLLITSEVDPKAPESSRDTFVEYVADGIIKLRMVESDTKPIKLILAVTKMRKTKCPRDRFAYEIGKGGISILKTVK